MPSILYNNILSWSGSVVLAAVFIYGIRKYRARNWGKCTNNVRLDGKVVIITGANSGLGFETAKILSAKGAHIIMACRNKKLALEAIDKIETANKIKGQLVFLELNLASLKSIVSFCSSVSKKYPAVDLLINNGGISIPVKEKLVTDDGFEVHFGVNYLSHFVLTNLLIPVLKESGDARIINIASMLHQKGHVNLTDINYETQSPVRPYADSKLQQIYFGQELANRTANTNINVYNLCPGWVYTNLFRHSKANILKMLFAIPIAFFFMRSVNQGAQTIIYCATEPSLSNESGQLYRDCRKMISTFDFTPIERQQLWQISKDIAEEKGIKLDYV